MTGSYILAIDQGTTGSTALVVDSANGFNVVGRKTVDFPQYFPQPGWVEHDLEEIWQSVVDAVQGALVAAQIGGSDIGCIGITNQRETLCPFSRESGKPVARAIVWQCRRSREICSELKEAGHEDYIREKTGLVLDPYFSGTKLRWLMENNPKLRQGAEAGDVVFGTIDSYILARLTSGASFCTEASNASRTMLFDIEKGAYDSRLLEIMKVPSLECLPEVRDSAGFFGATRSCEFLPDGIPITGILGDQQAALAGQTCFSGGDAKCTYGTGAFLLLNTGDDLVRSNGGQVTTVAWSLGGKRTFALEGSCFIAGAAVQYIRDQLAFVERASDSESIAQGCSAAPDVYFVPSLAGLGAPYWNAEARGAFLGLTRGTSKEVMVRAALEGIAFQVCDLIKVMDHDFPGAIKTLSVDGGACANNLLMQAQANFAGIEVDRPENIETTGFGAALFAGLGAGIYGGLEELADLRRTDRVFSPDSMFLAKKEACLQGWKRAVQAVQVFSGS